MNRLQGCFDDDAGDDVAGPLFQGMRHDPAIDAMHFQQRDHSPTLKAWASQEPCGYVDGLNVYSAPVDEPINPINPLGT
jgi:RHS repeat-associated protein